MQISAALPYIILTPLFLATAYLIWWRSLFYQTVVEHSEQTTYKTLDGLRGLLAISVFFVHAACHYAWLTTGEWTARPKFYNFLGQASVWCFFMITGFLFWSKVLRSNRTEDVSTGSFTTMPIASEHSRLNSSEPSPQSGDALLRISSVALEPIATTTTAETKRTDLRSPDLSWLRGKSLQRFYRARFLRIFPLYSVSVGLIFLVAFIQSGLTWQMSPPQFAEAFVQWFTCQLFQFPLLRGFVEFVDINGVTAWKINGGVAWSLAYEVSYYLVFPVLAWFAPLSRFIGLAAIVLGLNRWLPKGWQMISVVPPEIFATFLVGMAIAYLHQTVRLELICRKPWMTGVVMILVAIAAWSISTERFSVYLQVALIGLIFMVVLYGNTLFGLLISKSTRLLGAISYDIYLLHGIVLYVVCRGVNALYPLNHLPETAYWGLAAVCGVVAIAFSSLTHRYIESPFLKRQALTSKQVIL
jgi:peptidoglycan/LPS O-acetylase OafA/YrhL